MNAILNFRVFQRNSPDTQSRALRPDLPGGYLEEEGSTQDGEVGPGGGVPEALVLVLKSLRVFGHFEHSILLEIMKSIEYISLRQNDYLFKVRIFLRYLNFQ